MTPARPTLPRRLLSDEQGISLVELIVAMTLSVLILTIAGSFLISTQRASVTARAVNENTRTASAAMNEMTRVVRSATDNPVSTGDDPQYAFQYASPTSVRFFTYVNTSSTASQPVEVQLTLDPTARTITETKWAGTAVPYSDYFTFPMGSGATLTASPTSTRTLADSVVPTAVFTYWSASNSQLGSSVAPVGASDLPNIRRVTVTVTTGSSASDPRATTLTNSVNLPNILMGASS